MNSVKVEVKTNHLRAALLFASKNDIRYYLNGLHFRELNGYLAIEATDGHRAIRITTGVILPDPLSAIVPVEAVKAMIKKKFGAVPLTFQGKTATFDALTHKETWNLIDARHPDICAVMPKSWDHPIMAGVFNPSYIADAWASVLAFKGFGKSFSKTAILMLSEKLEGIERSGKAIYREKLDGETIEVVIMAMRT